MGTLITLDSILNPILLDRLFPTAQPLELEVGARRRWISGCLGGGTIDA